MLEKNFNAKEAEPRIAKKWEEAEAFKAGAGARVDTPYTIMMPPPNVTGSLHIGHALNHTLQDVLVRFERMRGKNTLWQPGLDHAGIATQMLVERQLSANNEPSRREMGREKFLNRVWDWKDEYGGKIVGQLKRLGNSCDWSRERFTMDDGLSKAVLEVFVSLHKDGLIYRDKRLVNWDPKLQTAVSDLEVENIEKNGKFWHFKYPIEEHEGQFITVATTRPETMLGDTAVAVNPEDERYQHLKGCHVRLPLVDRLIPIVFDEHADPEQGSGAVKITPAHDFNDFEVGKRHNLEQINILTATAHLNDDVPEKYRGLERFKARKAVIADMEELGLVGAIEDKVIMVPYDEKTKSTVIEPYLTDQWYVDAATLAKPALASVKEGRTKIVPKTWENTYFHWMENIQPWCISRQLWWGHQIPAWYAEDGTVFVERTEDEALKAAEVHFGKAVELTRDEDVLDTWFSSALWPFSTLGWPEKTPELDTYYQTDTLVTAFDILFFWVARMMMMSLHFMKDEEGNGIEPFKTVYIHALVRDKDGQKMSKTKGNVIDPLEIMDEYGTDAMRFTMAIMAAQGRDVKLDPERIAGYRNFVTKIWNATRFAQMNGAARDDNFKPENAKLTVNRWILSELNKARNEMRDGVEAFRFNDAASSVYKFTWNGFCDWYLELLKPTFAGNDEAAQAESRACMSYVLDEIYKMIHPFMPYVSEELWDLTGEGNRVGLLTHEAWSEDSFMDVSAADEVNWMIDLINEVRSVRVEMNVVPKNKVSLVFISSDEALKARVETHRAAISTIARVEDISFADAAPEGSAQMVVAGTTVSMPLAGVIDLDAENKRLSKELETLEKDINVLNGKLSNERFVQNAPEAVVTEAKERLAEVEADRAKVMEAMERLKSFV
jgi:valyl-tRNA synthetase